MRLPAGTWNVTTNPSILSASCVDGGITDACHRPPAPVGHLMTFSSPLIRVQRIVPAPSATMTLQDATQAGVFGLVGTGCGDNLKVRCARGEVWQISVTGPLALISAQNDVAPAEQHYNRAAILTELTRLDQLDQQVIAASTRRCFLTSLFACTRREIAWKLPTATDAAALTTTSLDRLCRLLFEDPQAAHVLQLYAQALQPVDELALAKALQATTSSVPCPPSFESLLALGRAIAHDEPEKDLLPACVRSIADHLPADATEEGIQQSIDTLADAIVNAKVVYQRRHLPPPQTAAIVVALYTAANRVPPKRILVPSVLTHPAVLSNDILQSFPFAKFVYTYATAYLRGDSDQVQQLYRAFASAAASAASRQQTRGSAPDPGVS
jgi:hypothetical protein